MKMLVHHYPNAETILLVQDNLNAHTAVSSYEAISSKEAFELAKRFEFHCTLKKGSWLNMAEIELSAFSKQFFDRGIDGMKKLDDEVNAWEYERNSIGETVRWRFNKDNAKVKLQRHYLNLQN